jgi:hypothetical protein
MAKGCYGLKLLWLKVVIAQSLWLNGVKAQIVVHSTKAQTVMPQFNESMKDYCQRRPRPRAAC